MEEKIKVAAAGIGYSELRPNQLEIVKSYCEGKDVFYASPTGSGKSLVFEVAPFVLEGVVLVISPLCALMTLQASNLNERGIKAGYVVGKEDNFTVKGSDETFLIKVVLFCQAMLHFD